MFMHHFCPIRVARGSRLQVHLKALPFIVLHRPAMLTFPGRKNGMDSLKHAKSHTLARGQDKHNDKYAPDI